MHISHEVEDLPNGSQLCFVNADSAKIQMQVEFATAGSFYSPDDLPETAHTMEHMIFEGSVAYPSARDFHDAVGGNAAYSNASTYEDRMEYHLVTPKHGADRAIDAYLGAIDRPLFKQAALDIEREVVWEELTSYLAEPTWIAAPHINRSIGFPDHSIYRSLDTLTDITPDDLRAHHQKTHTFDTMRTIVTGNLSDAEKARFIERLQGLSLNPVANVATVMPVPAVDRRIGVEEFDGASNITYWLGRFGVANVTSEDVVEHSVVANLLYNYPNATIMWGGREQGLIYGARGGWNFGALNSYDFEMTGGVSAEKAPQFARLLRTAMQNALDLTDLDTLERVKTYTIGLQQMYDHSSHAHSSVATQLRRYGRVRSDEETQAVIERLDIPTFQDSIRRGFAGGTTTGVLVGKAEMLQNEEVVSEFQATLDYLDRL